MTQVSVGISSCTFPMGESLMCKLGFGARLRMCCSVMCCIYVVKDVFDLDGEASRSIYGDVLDDY